MKPIPYMGAGIFGDNRAKVSLKKVCRTAYISLGNPNIDRQSAKKYRTELLRISNNYWAAKKHDEQLTFAAIKKYLISFRLKLKKAATELDELPLEAKRELFRVLSSRDENERDVFVVTADLMEILLKACDRLIKPSYKKAGKALAIPGCCSALERIWAEITGDGVPRTKSLGSGSNGDELTSRGANFIHAVINAIDDKVGAKQVRSWLATTPPVKIGKNRPSKKR